MTTLVAGDVKILRLHVDDDGRVWYGDDLQLAINSYLPSADFLLKAEGLEFNPVNAKCVRLLGTAANAPLVVQLQQLRAGRPELLQLQRVQLGSPALVPTCATRSDPSSVLQHLWQPTYCNRCPGMWHDMTHLDFCTYYMISESRNTVEVPEVVRRTATYHPAWPAISFIDGLDHDLGCRLICEIVDPRWYKHPFRPGRPTKLYAHLGLTPKNMEAYLNDTPGDRHYDRARIVAGSWYDNKRGDAGPKSPSGAGSFIWRAYGCAKDRVHGLLRGCQRLVDFIRAIWSQAVQPVHPEARFEPLRFFGDKLEAARFLEHYEAQKQV